jgi:hypothetical protein
MNGATSTQYAVVGVDTAASDARPAACNVSPIPINRAPPILSDSAPAIGATNIGMIVQGRMRRPEPSGECPARSGRTATAWGSTRQSRRRTWRTSHAMTHSRRPLPSKRDMAGVVAFGGNATRTRRPVPALSGEVQCFAGDGFAGRTATTTKVGSLSNGESPFHSLRADENRSFASRRKSKRPSSRRFAVEAPSRARRPRAGTRTGRVGLLLLSPRRFGAGGARARSRPAGCRVATGARRWLARSGG